MAATRFVRVGIKTRFLWHQKHVVVKRLGCMTFATKLETMAEIKEVYRQRKNQISGKLVFCTLTPVDRSSYSL